MFGIKRHGSQEPLTLKRILWNQQFVKRELKNIIRRRTFEDHSYTDIFIKMSTTGLWSMSLNNHLLLDQMITQYRYNTEEYPFIKKQEDLLVKSMTLEYQRKEKKEKEIRSNSAKKAWKTRRKHARNEKVRKLARKRAASKHRARKTRRKKS